MFEAYWSPIFNKLRKREQQIHIFRMQLHNFKLNSVPPPLEKMEKEERKSVLMKFTKANLKLNIPLEPYQAVELFDFFIECTLCQIDVIFSDWKGLKELIETFSSSDLKH